METDECTSVFQWAHHEGLTKHLAKNFQLAVANSPVGFNEPIPWFLHSRVLTFIVNFYFTTFKGLKSHFYKYDTKVEKDILINEDDAHKVFFCTFSDILKIFYMWQNRINLQVRYHKTHSHSSHLNRVRDSQNSDFDEDTIANEDGQHFYVKMLFSSK